MRTLIMTAALLAATSLSTAYAADLRMSWWGSDEDYNKHQKGTWSSMLGPRIVA